MLVDYQLVSALLPTQLIFSSFGVMLNITMPEVIQTIVFILILILSTFATLWKAVRMFKMESKGDLEVTNEVSTQTSVSEEQYTEDYWKESVTESNEVNANDVSDPMVNRARESTEVRRKVTLESDHEGRNSMTPL